MLVYLFIASLALCGQLIHVGHALRISTSRASITLQSTQSRSCFSLFARKIDEEAAELGSSSTDSKGKPTGRSKGKTTRKRITPTIEPVAATANSAKVEAPVKSVAVAVEKSVVEPVVHDSNEEEETGKAMLEIARAPIKKAGAFSVADSESETSGDPFTSNARDNIFATGEFGNFENPGLAQDVEETEEDKRNRAARRAGTPTETDQQQQQQQPMEKALRVPRDDPLAQSIVPPEVVFFGDPRKPPPIEGASSSSDTLSCRRQLTLTYTTISNIYHALYLDMLIDCIFLLGLLPSNLTNQPTPTHTPTYQDTLQTTCIYQSTLFTLPFSSHQTAARDVKYHGALLHWARHATVAPRTSEERLASVFPRGRLSPEALKYRLTNTPESLTYQTIFNGFVAVMDDLEASKAYIEANIDLVPSKLFLRYVHQHCLDIPLRYVSIHPFNTISILCSTPSTHPISTPINTPYLHTCQPTYSLPPYPYARSTHPIFTSTNTPYQYTYLSIPYQHTLSTNIFIPINTSIHTYQPTYSHPPYPPNTAL